ncbi:restriction endonuclease subunit S [Falsiroseomonas bella]|uniref:restriction endonuclease subunit S n=1 Tax=Falsiroseomonas bella TaxID=2184016 RepID=UPI001304838B|nr:restriction endonuclease subunit S [Falsiroseomonas bella]
MSAPAYPGYRESGVDWIGAVPAHWNVTPLKGLIERNDGGVWGSDPDGVKDTVVLRSTEQTVDGRWRIEDPAVRKLTADEIEATLLIEGDLLLTKSSGSSLHIGKTTLVDRRVAALRCCYSNFMQRIRLNSSLLPELAWYVLNSDLARIQFDFLSNSTTGLANLNGTIIGRVIVPVPPLDEQRDIADFLGRECSKIDTLIAEQERLVALLDEKRQAVISQAVTRGLNHDVPMKDLGIEWLGAIPAHWELTRLKHFVGGLTVGVVVTPTKYYADDGVPALRSLNVREMRLVDENLVFFRPDAHAELQKSALRIDDLVAVRTGKPGTTAVVGPDFDGANCIDLIIIRKSSAFSSRFLAYAMNSETCRVQYELGAEGAIHTHFNVETASNLKIALPPRAEQNEITEYLDQTCGELDSLREEAERAISLLRERRAALISAAVTGKIDVRGLVPLEEAA